MNIFKNSNGFTLIELIVSIAIIGLISGIMVANYRQGGSSEELNIATQNLVSEIRKAQGYALSYKEYAGSISDVGGWGIRLTDDTAGNPENFILFFDLSNSGKSDILPTNEVFVNKVIGKNVHVSDISDGTDHSSYFWAIFYPPDPIIMLRGSDHPTDGSFVFGATDSAIEVTITLEHSRGATKSIILNKFGLVDVD
ncbi:MAG: prepilin-type N-terminal cleavage/methylation domain-containing protein [Patescibacteria group bacterium]|jgi:prepilin-type N-terminal cleavage/methylation domain-containing protein|nr:prepilin-type N-terminal cleavage/methylation domain-containing protein [Patescibacteria group bacterium]